ncbi:sugar kinase [Streptomyces spirodelae]|uniref:Sugar kinase n=1 Tax=Streptomyces spirodelae TaxID=2812904 RepID=A0ABS3WXL6_9ACTN|nr:sugar kinase [Streptomyces spirodelae]MBO8187596.1 sugar kinase [Streptomyces spirodelae]
MTTTPQVDVVCLGESMVTFLPGSAGPLADVPSFDRAIGGAESNVACTLARAGHRAAWVGRVGTDGFGDHLVRTIAEHGVDTSAVERDPERPTGIYFRTNGERATGAVGAGEGTGATGLVDGTGPAAHPGPLSEVLYYRAGSAASAMSPANVPRRVLRAGKVLHLTGITAALSTDCLALLRELTSARTPADRGGGTGPLVSFDVNYRVGLWRTPTVAERGAEVLRELARHSDLVFVGEDEAAAAWGVTGGPEAVREALAEPAVLVVKQGATGATAFTREGTAVFAPALRVDVVSPVGAGDAFAAGFLAGTLRGLPVDQRLRHGHLTAAAALTDAGDLAAPPGRDLADRLAALDAESWAGLRLGPGWTTHGPRTATAGRPDEPAEPDQSAVPDQPAEPDQPARPDQPGRRELEVRSV